MFCHCVIWCGRWSRAMLYNMFLDFKKQYFVGVVILYDVIYSVSKIIFLNYIVCA